MKRLFLFLSCLVFGILGGTGILFAQSRKVATNNPMSLLKTIVDKANETNDIQNTKLNEVDSRDGGYGKFKLTGTLVSLKNNINPYLQWIIFIWLALATILLIYNGFMMTTNIIHGKGELSKVKDNFIYIGIGVVVLTGFYYLIDIVLAVINFLFN